MLAFLAWDFKDVSLSPINGCEKEDPLEEDLIFIGFDWIQAFSKSFLPTFNSLSPSSPLEALLKLFKSPSECWHMFTE